MAAATWPHSEYCLRLRCLALLIQLFQSFLLVSVELCIPSNDCSADARETISIADVVITELLTPELVGLEKHKVLVYIASSAHELLQDSRRHKNERYLLCPEPVPNNITQASNLKQR